MSCRKFNNFCKKHLKRDQENKHEAAFYNFHEVHSFESSPAPGDISFFMRDMKFSFHKTQSQKTICNTDIPRWKRVLDIVFILLILPLVLPLSVLIAALIYMVSDGPV